MDMATLTTFLGWCTVINFGFLVFAGLGIIGMRGWIAGIHGKMFGLDEATLSLQYFQYLGRFKSVIVIFNAVPWIALKIMAG